ncbi:MAG: ComEC/Rec2 family competence protein [Candidatus Doudnabacteria bacterium]|nr:ComEC/Rec2 family competence protein [Candidatus Doudnabacteria bacterium]
MRRRFSQIFLVAASSFFAGVGLGSFIDPRLSRIFFYSSVILGTVFFTVKFKNRFASTLALMVVLFGFGAFYFNFRQVKIDQAHIASFNDSGKITWEGTVTEEPDWRGNKVNLTIAATKMSVPKEQAIVGRVLVTVAPYPEYAYGQKLVIVGTLETPFEEENFSYKRFLAKDRIFSVSFYPKMKALPGEGGNFLKKRLLNFKAAFMERLNQIIPEPENSLVLGLLLGARRTIPSDLQEAFKITGLSHIVAISGFNISIITALLGGFVVRRLGAKAAFLSSLLFVSAFVVLTGAQPSVVRAAIMGLLGVVALNLGRRTLAMNVLVVAALVMVALNPNLLAFDLGFQLSFLATSGLVLLGGVLEKWFAAVPNFLGLRTILATTIAAQVFVTPLLVFHFDRLSLVSPLANLLVLPTIPLTMLFGFLSAVGAFIAIPLGYLAGWPAWLLLHYQIFSAEQLSRLPFATLALDNLSALWVANYYLVLLLGLFVLHARAREQKIVNFRNYGTKIPA